MDTMTNTDERSPYVTARMTKPEALASAAESIRRILDPPGPGRIVIAAGDDTVGGIVLVTVTSIGAERVDVVHAPNAQRSGAALLRSLGISEQDGG